VPVPTDFARRLAEIGDLANGIGVRLTTMRYAGNGERDFAALRDQLQDFVNLVMAAARSTEQ
jgi:hypothetical protein